MLIVEKLHVLSSNFLKYCLVKYHSDKYWKTKNLGSKGDHAFYLGINCLIVWQVSIFIFWNMFRSIKTSGTLGKSIQKSDDTFYVSSPPYFVLYSVSNFPCTIWCWVITSTIITHNIYIIWESSLEYLCSQSVSAQLVGTDHWVVIYCYSFAFSGI